MLTVTASELPRLMNCNGSRLMGGATPPIETADLARDEGNAADWLALQVFHGIHSAEELIDRKAPNGVYITAEMVEHLSAYLKNMNDFGPDCGDDSYSMMQFDTSYGTQNWNVGGRADNMKFYSTSCHLEVNELKYGWSIVEPEMNWTLISHVMGFMMQRNNRVDTVTLKIFQPRPHHPKGPVRSWDLNRAQIAELYNQINATLSNPSDILNTGNHCYKCPALAICPAARKAQMNAIDTSERAFIDNIDNDNLSFQLDHLTRAKKILDQMYKAYDELALHRMKSGQIIQNYGLDTELSNRHWHDHVTPEFMTTMTGKDLSKKQLITPAQAEKMGVEPEFVNAFSSRKQKGVKVVRIDADTKARKTFAKK